MRTFFLTTDDGVRLGLHASSAGHARVLLVHGWMASHLVWHRLLAELKDVETVALDLRGCGDSARGSAALTLSRLAADVRAVLESLGPQPLHLVGHSMGGQLAQLVAAAVPGRLASLTLLNPVPVEGLALPAELATAFRNAGGNRAALAGIFAAACRTLPAEALEPALDDAMRIEPAVIAETFSAWSTGVQTARLECIDAPTLVVATDDPFLPPALLEAGVVRRIHGARLEVLKGPGHYPSLEAPAQTAALLRRAWGA